MSKQLETYLNELRSQLKNLPANQREAEVEETRQHLLAIIEQQVEQGDSHEAAVSAAIARFGNAQTNGKALRRAHSRQNSSPAQRLLSILHGAIVGSLSLQFLSIAFPTMAVRPLVFPDIALSVGNSFMMAWPSLFLLALLPLALLSSVLPRFPRQPLFAATTVFSLWSLSLTLTRDHVVPPDMVYRYIFVQLFTFAFSIGGLWLAVKQGQQNSQKPMAPLGSS